MKYLVLRAIGLAGLALSVAACNDQGNERLAEKANIESAEATKNDLEAAQERGKREATASLQADIDNIDKIKKRAFEEGRSTSEAQLKSDMDNIDSLKRKAYEEGRSSAQAQVETETVNREKRAKEMEADLKARQRFYQAVRGTYEGTLDGTDFIRLTLIPSLPPYSSTRIRTLEEIASDLNNLYFNAQIVEGNPAMASGADGCRITQIRPDIQSGEITLISEDANCPNVYTFKLSGTGSELGTLASNKTMARSAKYAVRVVKGDLKSVSTLAGKKQKSNSAATTLFTLRKAVETLDVTAAISLGATSSELGE